jgi:opacity protein-like surface antigen
MKKLLFSIIGAALLPLLSFAQNWEIGVMLGGSNYSGDLTEAPVVLSETHPAGGAFLRYNVNKNFALKGNAYYGTISGNDANNTTARLVARNLSFRSNVFEVGANAEYNIGGFEVGGRKNRFAPYIFGGLAIFKFDPEGYLDDTKEWVRLQPLGTEGQGTTKYNDRHKYSLTQVSIPIGAGLKWNFSGAWTLGFEAGMRKTFTDYLDDVSTTYVDYGYLEANNGELAARMSNRTGDIPPYTRQEYTDKDQRGNPTNKDWYMFAGVTLSYTLMAKKCYEF